MHAVRIVRETFGCGERLSYLEQVSWPRGLKATKKAPNTKGKERGRKRVIATHEMEVSKMTRATQ